MFLEELLKAKKDYINRWREDNESNDIKICRGNGFFAGAKWALAHQWHEISRDKDGFAIDENLGEVIIREDDGTIYINDDDDYIHNTHCVYWMPIPSLPDKVLIK
jgi:hypothetical protein